MAFILIGCKSPTHTPPVLIKVHYNDKDALVFNPWVSVDGVCYFFLPSFSHNDDAFIVPTKTGFTINNNVIDGPISLSDLLEVTNTTIDGFLLLNGCGFDNLKMKILYSSNLSSVFITTASGSLDFVHADKNNVEDIVLRVFDKEGNIDYYSDNSTIKGRGHGTWGREKKPYLLRLPLKESLLGMRKSKKWVLLANANDNTNLRNWIAFRMAAESQLVNTPQIQFVDVWINDNYIGLYNITEKVDEKHLTTDVRYPALVKIETDATDNVIVSDRGTRIVVENIGTGFYSIESIKDSINRFEEALFNGDGVQFVDIDSWACKYLVDEITENGDAGARSNYFYFFEDSLYFYGGPIWDYDLSLGRNKFVCGDPRTFTAKRAWRTPNEYTPYYSLLLSDESFYSRIIDLYQSDFVPVIESLVNTKIKEKASEIEASSIMNSIRWNEMFAQKIFPAHKPTVYDASGLCVFLKERMAFLNSAWMDGKQYWLVQVNYNDDGQYMCYSVEDGNYFDLAQLKEDPDFASLSWIDKETGEKCTSPIFVNKDKQFILTPECREQFRVKSEESMIDIVKKKLKSLLK